MAGGLSRRLPTLSFFVFWYVKYLRSLDRFYVSVLADLFFARRFWSVKVSIKSDLFITRYLFLIWLILNKVWNLLFALSSILIPVMLSSDAFITAHSNHFLRELVFAIWYIHLWCSVKRLWSEVGSKSLLEKVQKSWRSCDGPAKSLSTPRFKRPQI